MTIELDPDAVRQAWQTGAALGLEELDAVDGLLASARGTSMGDLAGCLASAVEAFAGVAVTGRALVTEYGLAVEGCLAVWEATDHETVGQLQLLEAAVGGP